MIVLSGKSTTSVLPVLHLAGVQVLWATLETL